MPTIVYEIPVALVGAYRGRKMIVRAHEPTLVLYRAPSDHGVFAAFTDPNAATSLEVIEFDEQALAARPFKVLQRDGRWTIPSHDNYPADAGTRLAGRLRFAKLRRESVRLSLFSRWFAAASNCSSARFKTQCSAPSSPWAPAAHSPS
jgi:hypothetical protein